MIKLPKVLEVVPDLLPIGAVECFMLYYKLQVMNTTENHLAAPIRPHNMVLLMTRNFAGHVLIF
jgi:hypothetical protein